MTKDGLMSMGSLVHHTTMKCVAVGDGAVGKTCMLVSYAMDRFPIEYVPTVFENYIAHVQVGTTSVPMGLFDTAGQEGYDRLRVSTYGRCDVFLVCFSTISPDSMKNAEFVWIPEIREAVGNDAKIILVGTKTDLRLCSDTLQGLRDHGQSPVKYEEGVQMAKRLKCMEYLECSALTQQGLNKIFDSAAAYALKPTKPVKAGFKKLMCWRAC